MKRLFYSVMTLLLTVAVFITVTYSWFTNTEFVEPDLSGFSVSAYFGGGTGTVDDPFQIKNQRHLYNLCWLQYLGYFNKEGALDDDGRIVTTNHTTELTQYSFSIETDLNMNGWYLPPLGTTLYPFIGLLNGQGHSIYNLNTTNNFSEFGNKRPSSVTSANFANVEIIGFAGVVGKIDSMADSDHSIDPDLNAVANIKLKNNYVKTVTPTSLIGIAAGYINGTVEDIGIVDSGLYVNSTTKLANMDDISTYTVAGYATDNYVIKTSNTKASVLNPSNTSKTSYVFSDEGDTAGWGGSIDMKSTFERIYDIGNSGSYAKAMNTTTYSIKYDIYPDYQGNIVEIGDGYSIGSDKYYVYNEDCYNGTYNERIGSYNYVIRGSGGTSTYNYLNGGYYYEDINDTAYKITDGTNYMRIVVNGNTRTIENTTDADLATPFIFSSLSRSSIQIYTYIGTTRYYLYPNTGTLSLNTSSKSFTNYRINNNTAYTLCYGSSSNFYYLGFDGTSWNMIKPTNGFYVSSSDTKNYLSVNSSLNITNSSTVTSANLWYMNNNKVYTYVNNTPYYLVGTSTSLSLTNNINNATSFTANCSSAGRISLYYNYSNGWTSSTYYLRYSNSNWSVSTSSSNLYLRTNLNLIEYNIDTSSLPSVDYSGKDITYFPLNVDSSYNPVSSNTGYIVGGTRYDSSYGSIRISTYGQYYSSSVQNLGNYSYENECFNPNSVYTINNNNQVVLIDDTNNSFEKYAATKEKVESIIESDTSSLYGLHFMDDPVSIDNLVTARYVLIDKVEYRNYQLPASTIDFNLHSKGYVNFFAGTYGRANDYGDNAFFSVHQIFRDSSNNIIYIKEIASVYSNGDENSAYIYCYKDGTYSAPYTIDSSGNRVYSDGYNKNSFLNSIPSGYSLVFNTSCLAANADIVNYRRQAFYFEIPMNDGEFAMGSVTSDPGNLGDDISGAYLMYLDISANAQKLNRTTITQKSTITQYDYMYPKGIAIITDSTTIDDAINSASLNASISSVLQFNTVSGEKSILVSRTSNTNINAVTDIDVTSTYINRTQTLTKNSGAMSATAIRTTASIYSQIVYIDHNVSTGNIFETIIQKIDSNNPTYKINKIGENNTTTGFTPVEIDTTAQSPAWKLYAVKDGKNVEVNLTNASDTNATAIKSSLTTIAASTGTACLEYDYDTVTGATNTYSIHIDMSLNSDELYYYVFAGDTITVTTSNTGGTTIYVTTRNTSYTFYMNGNVINASTISVAQAS